MSDRECVVVIPARMNGTRLPGKPLLEIAGKPMLLRVWEQCLNVFPERDIFVATEDKVIQDFCLQKNIQCILTEKAESAIDRLYLFSRVVKSRTYINVQGDEPLINPEDVRSIAKYSRRFPDRVVFGKTEASQEEFMDLSKAKVVCDINGRLLYSSRTGIPVSRSGQYIKAKRAIWIYAFSAKSLELYFKSSDVSSLDKIEDNEILRFLEIGEPVYCIDLIGDSWAVDEFKDIQIVEEILESKRLI